MVYIATSLKETASSVKTRFYLKFDDYEIDGETYDWFKHKYKDWKEAFRVASNNGAVIFH